jgi:hypothetical protein
MTHAAAATTFFERIFSGAPVGTALVLSTPREGWRPHAVGAGDAETAARIALALGRDVFVGVGLQDAAAVQARAGRGRAADIVALVAGWADLDITKLGATKHYLPDQASARRVVAALPILPTVTVSSGGGFQLWWCMTKALVLDTATDREQAARLVRRWQAVLRQRLGGYALDRTHDISRVLRVPGTINGKYNCRVVLEQSDGPRLDPSKLEDMCVGVPDTERPIDSARSSLGITLDPPPSRPSASSRLCAARRRSSAASGVGRSPRRTPPSRGSTSDWPRSPRQRAGPTRRSSGS